MFPPAVINRLGYYVYFLKDPRNNEIFYVGKGIGNRVFFHIKEAQESSRKGDKLDRIRQILRQGLLVEHYILRHGLTESAAFELEAAAIDLLGIERLSNLTGGHHSSDFGLKSAKDILAMYQGLPFDTDEPVLLININNRYCREMSPAEVYLTTRQAWLLGPRRNAVKYVVAVYQGLTREVYEVKKWYPIAAGERIRWGFKGRLAKYRIRKEMRYKSVRHLFRRGATNPLKYVNC